MQSESYLKKLAYLTRSEALVSSCIRRIRNYCLIDGFKLQEKFQPLNIKFQLAIYDYFMEFLQSALELYFMCGFVPFVIRKKDGIAIPVALPPGTFTWIVEPAPKTSHKIMQYKVNVVTGNVKEEDIIIYDILAPSAHKSELCSPIDALVEHHERLKQVLDSSVLIERHNAQKHILLSENVDLKEQTSNGIMLLDEFRRYTLSGWHPGAAHATAMRMRNAPLSHKFNNVNDASIAWVQSEFADDDSVRATVIPPNTTVTELQNIRRENDLEKERENWSNLVHSFFDIPSQESKQGKVNAAEANLLSREQFTNIRYICDILERLVEFAYKKCYDVKTPVLCKIDPQSRLSVNNTEDVKKLVEANMLEPADKSKVREMFLPSSKRPRR